MGTLDSTDADTTGARCAAIAAAAVGVIGGIGFFSIFIAIFVHRYRSASTDDSLSSTVDSKRDRSRYDAIVVVFVGLHLVIISLLPLLGS